MATPANPSMASYELDQALVSYRTSRDRGRQALQSVTDATAQLNALAATYGDLITYINGLPAGGFNNNLKEKKNQMIADYTETRDYLAAVDVAIAAVDNTGA